jgi:hypothetical protein
LSRAAKELSLPAGAVCPNTRRGTPRGRNGGKISKHSRGVNSKTYILISSSNFLLDAVTREVLRCPSLSQAALHTNQNQARAYAARAHMNSVILIILDSCRFDSFARAMKPSVDKLALRSNTGVERRFSYASWTAPSHYAFLMGLLPHRSLNGVFASEVYKKDIAAWSERLACPDIDFSRLVPHLSFPKLLNELGYRTVGRVSLPVLNESTALAFHFHDYRMMDDHNDFRGMIDGMSFEGETPYFYFLNVGETHYPYMLDDGDLPRISGIHGAVKWLGREGEPSPPAFFDQSTMTRLHAQQVRCVEYVDGLLPRLFAKCRPGTHVIITADHGELFGEDGYFGHGPVMHEKVFEVPFVEGRVPSA